MQTLTQNRPNVNPSLRLPNQVMLTHGLHSEATIVDRLLTALIDKLQDRHFEIEKSDDPGGGTVHICYMAPRRLDSILQKEGRSDLMFDRRIVPIPGPILNAVVCQHLSERFTDWEMEIAGCFRQAVFGSEDDLPTAICWRLDVDPWLCRQGFMFPVYREGFIHGLKVYRYPRDERPFILRARQEVALYA